MDYQPASNLGESARAGVNWSFSKSEVLVGRSYQFNWTWASNFHFRDGTPITVQTVVNCQHLCIVHQCGGVSTLGLGQLDFIHALEQLVLLQFEKPRKWHCYIGRKVFAIRTPNAIFAHCGVPSTLISHRIGQTWPLQQHIVVHVTSCDHN